MGGGFSKIFGLEKWRRSVIPAGVLMRGNEMAAV
jgi:hypothetical protein